MIAFDSECGPQEEHLLLVLSLHLLDNIPGAERVLKYSVLKLGLFIQMIKLVPREVLVAGLNNIQLILDLISVLPQT